MSLAGNEDENAPKRVTAIRVCGFKSIATEQRIEIGPLTILAGANSSGKSSIMQPLLLLKQTMEAPYDPGPLLVRGPHVSVTRFDQLLCRTSSEQVATRYSLTFDCSSWGRLELRYVGSHGGRFHVEWTSNDPEWKGKCGPIRIGMTDADIRRVLPPGLKRFTDEQGKVDSWQVVRDRQYSHFGGVLRAEYVEQVPSSTFVPRQIVRISEIVRKLIHVPAHRDNPEATYPVAAIGSEFAGPFQRYAASVVLKWQQDCDEHLDELADTLLRLGLTSMIHAESIGGARVALHVERTTARRAPGEEVLIPIADVGQGVAQILPVLVALLIAEPDQVVYLEEPETHLHPRALQALASELVNAAKRGANLVVETHSDVLLRGIQTLVAKGEIAPESVKLYWFTRDAVSGATEVTPATLDENGAYGDWPTDFDDVALDVEGSYLDAVERRAAK